MKQKLIELELMGLSKAKSLIPAISEVIKEFHNKVPNKRLDTALKKIDKNLHFKIKYNSFVISLFIENRMVIDQSMHHCEYIKNISHNIVHTAIESAYGDGACQCNMIQADVLIECLNRENKYLTDTIKEIKSQMKRLDKIKAKYERIKKDMSDFNDNTSYMIREYYGLNFKN